MARLTEAERTALKKRVKEIDRQIQNPRLTIEQCDLLRKQREELRKALLNDKAEM